MSINSVIEHRANYHFLKIQEDYLTICEGNHCQALILDVLEEWTNTKRKTAGQSAYIYMTYPQWSATLYGAYGRNAIMKALTDRESKGLIEKRPYRLYGKDTFEYRLKTQAVNSLLLTLAEKKPDATLPDIQAFKKGRNVDSLTQNTNNINPEEAVLSEGSPSQSEPSTAALTTFSFESVTGANQLE